MGLFDVFKKPKGEAKAPPAPPAGPLMQALIQRHGLVPGKPPPASGYSGTWWEQPPNDDLLPAFMERGDKLVAFLGDPVEITEIYLVRGASGAFGLGASTDSPKLAAVQALLPRLSASVEELQVYENHEGVSLRFAVDAKVEQVEADLEVARAVLRAVESG